MKNMTRRTGASSDFPRPEYAFLAIGLVFGLMLIFVNPPFQSNDEFRMASMKSPLGR